MTRRVHAPAEGRNRLRADNTQAPLRSTGLVEVRPSWVPFSQSTQIALARSKVLVEATLDFWMQFTSDEVDVSELEMAFNRVDERSIKSPCLTLA